jgi:hypothetical protein
MKLLVRLNSAVSAAKNGPDTWPNEVRHCADDDPVPDGFTVITPSDLDACLAAHQAEYDTWRATQDAATAKAQAVEACRQARASRYDAEASVYDLADAETKIASSDPTEQAAGAAQKAAVLAQRLQIKSDLPKPQ